MGIRISTPLPLALLAMAAGGLGTAPAVAAEAEAMIADAVKAAPPGLAETVKVMDWEGTVLREGSGTYVCFPTPPQLSGTAPMCMDGTWMKWGEAWQGKTPFQAERLGISYMLAGDEGASNTDPYAKGPTEGDDWVVEGPHLMLVVPDAAMLDGIPTDPTTGGPYVMWAGTPYAHVMVPVGPRPQETAAK